MSRKLVLLLTVLIVAAGKASGAGTPAAALDFRGQDLLALTSRIMAPGAESNNIQRDAWVLPGLTVQVETDARGASVAATQGYIEITYRDATRFALRPKATR
jgi:hypothetical protein